MAGALLVPMKEIAAIYCSPRLRALGDAGRGVDKSVDTARKSVRCIRVSLILGFRGIDVMTRLWVGIRICFGDGYGIAYDVQFPSMASA